MLDNEIYEYPALFTLTDDGKRLDITFPDFPGSESDCENPEYEAMIELAIQIALKQEDDEPMPKPSNPDKIPLNTNTQKVKMIRVLQEDIRKEVEVIPLL